MQEHLSYRPATPRTHQFPNYPHVVCCQLTYEEDNTFSHMLENNLSEDDILACHLPSIAEEEDYDMEEHCPTVSLDDNFWMEEPVPERHLCINENVQHDLCPYPCPYGFNQLNHVQEDTVQYIDLNDIFEFPDVMVLPTMMIYQVWKISLNSEEDTNVSLQNLFDKNMEYTCGTLLIEDLFINSDTSAYNQDIQ